MKIVRHLTVPTGDILVVEGQQGNLEMLSLGNYGKDVNLKCDAMGLSRDLGKIRHTDMLPLEEKWVVTISTQYGCSMGCEFCDVPKVGIGINASVLDIVDQVLTGLGLHPEVTSTKRLNIHFARMGEPTFNSGVLVAAELFHRFLQPAHMIHPVVSTMMPRQNKKLTEFIFEWMMIKNDLYEGNAGLQLSINSTSEGERHRQFNGNALTLADIAEIMSGLTPVGRKITLNFAVANYEIDPDTLLKHFDPAHYIVKLTPMHKTATAIERGIETDGDYTQYYPYKCHEEALKAAGYDVLVLIASEYEDLGRITCGNAILSGTLPLVPYDEVV